IEHGTNEKHTADAAYSRHGPSEYIPTSLRRFSCASASEARTSVRLGAELSEGWRQWLCGLLRSWSRHINAPGLTYISLRQDPLLAANFQGDAGDVLKAAATPNDWWRNFLTPPRR
ncbi:MAG: hypothetical protein L6R42_001105, partial [Xanthoria sp. 1 TBL-2021]